MAGKSNTHETSVLNLLRATSITAPAAVYVTLFSANPTDAYTAGVPTGTEAAVTRAAITFAAPTGTPRSVTNTNAILITMPAVTVSAVGIFDAATAGNLLYWVAITAKTFDAGDSASFAASAITVTED